MKSYIFLICVFLSLFICKFISAQNDFTELNNPNKPVRIGLGIDLLDFYEYGKIGSFLLPVDLNKFRIEPEIYFNREKSKDRLTSEYSEGLSCYSVLDLKSINLLTGGTIIHKNLKQEFDQEEYNTKSIIFGPIIGVEYFFIDNFSIGINLGLVYELLKIDDWDGEIRNYKNIATESGFRIRFYL